MRPSHQGQQVRLVQLGPPSPVRQLCLGASVPGSPHPAPARSAPSRVEPCPAPPAVETPAPGREPLPLPPGPGRLEPRGGSYLCHESYCNGYRSSARMKASPDTSLSHTGFRCVLTADKAARTPTQREHEASRAAVLQRCGEIACLPSWGQAAGALALAKRSLRGRRSSQLYAMTRRPLQACEASDASQTAGACITSG
jgi:Sulfatase-modifying factor enzyme 1